MWGWDRKIHSTGSAFVTTRQALWSQLVILGTDFSIPPSFSWLIFTYWYLHLPLLSKSYDAKWCSSGPVYSNTFVKRSLLKRPQIGFKTKYRLMQVKEGILQYVWPSLSYHLSCRWLFCLFFSSRFTQVLLLPYVLFKESLSIFDCFSELLVATSLIRFSIYCCTCSHFILLHSHVTRWTRNT